MSKTDKTAPLKVRIARGEFDQKYRADLQEAGFRTKVSKSSWAERGSGPKGVKLAKRVAAKARRRGNKDPHVVKSLTTTYSYNCG